MKIGIFSDLHLEFASWNFTPEADVFYLNAGDTHPYWHYRDVFHSRFRNGSEYHVYGNHDFYGDSFKEAKEYGIMEPLWIDGGRLKIVGATLWTDVRPDEWMDFCFYMMDYRQISNMTYDAYIDTHTSHKKYLLESNADIWVVHHGPSFRSMNDMYRGSSGNQYFYSNMDEEILGLRKPPKLIVHGHTHKPCDYMLGETRVICHPRGYPGESPDFHSYVPKVIEL